MRVRVGPADIYLERGDITEYEVDAIVNAASSDLSMGTGVASTIKRKGGTIVEEEATRQSPVEGGDAVVTTAGNLAANYVIHAAVLGADHRANADLVRQATRNSLRRAEELRLHTLAFPAFGTGAGRLEPKESAEAMVGALAGPLRGGGGVERPADSPRPVPGRRLSGVWLAAGAGQGPPGELTAPTTGNSSVVRRLLFVGCR